MNSYSKKGKAKHNNRDWRHVDDLLNFKMTVLQTEFAPSFYLPKKDLKEFHIHLLNPLLGD